MTTETRSLHRKLAQVMYEADRIPKNGTAPTAMGGFKFVQVGDAADVIRKALAEHKVSMIPTAIELISEAEHETKSGGTMTTLTVRTTWTLTDGDSGESIVIQSMGSGADTGDKAIPKAQTNAMKYALLMGFLLSTGDDPELSDSSDRKTRAQEPERPDAGGATEHLLGIETFEGTVRLGTADAYKLEVRETEEGPAFGFRLEMAKGAVPQVVVKGDPATVAIAGSGGDPAVMKGHWARVRGRLVSVRKPGHSAFNRLYVSEIETREWRYPPSETTGQEASSAGTPEVAGAGPLQAAPDPDLAAFQAAHPSLALLGEEA